MKPILTIILMLGLAGCIRHTEPEPLIAPAPPTSGLKQQEPDSCGADALSTLIGQPQGMIRTVRIDRIYRVVPLGALVTQEYNSGRVNFYLDETETIARISCG